MTGKELLKGMGEVSQRYVQEAERFVPAEAKRRMSPRRALLVAVAALLMLLVGCGAAWVYLGWADRNEIDVSSISQEDIHLTVLEASPSGATVRCNIDGVSIMSDSITMLEWPITLERETASGWEALERLQPDEAYTGREILSDGELEYSVQWSTVYGLLTPGKYRLSTMVLEDHDLVYAEFEITEAMLPEQFETVSQLLDREFCHIRIRYDTVLAEQNTVPEDQGENLAQFIEEYAVYEEEFLKSGQDMMALTYRDGALYMGVLYREGVKYKLTNEDPETRLSPIAGWEVWPDYDLNRMTAWVDELLREDGKLECAYSEDGSLKRICVTTPRREGDYAFIDHYEMVYEVLTTGEAEIAGKFAEQDVDFSREFSWEADQRTYPALDVAHHNVDAAPIETAAEAIALAKNECSVDYTQIRVYRDEGAKMWKVEFQILYGYQGYQFVYLSDEGITQRVSEAGPKEETAVPGMEFAN